MTEELFELHRLQERVEILEKKVEELLRATPRITSSISNYPSQEFLAFWDVYPRKRDMKKAWAAWRKCSLTRPPLEEILKAVRKHKKSEQWQRGIIPLPTTYINGERWHDEN